MAQTQIKTQTTTTLTYPNRYNVVILNDNFTPVDFVIRMLIEVFNKDIDTANGITMEIHHNGKGVAGCFSKEIAEQKVHECNILSSHAGHPLKTITETV